MSCFVFSGKKKVRLRHKPFREAAFLCDEGIFTRLPTAEVARSMASFFEREGSRFLNRKVCVVIPDNTRDFHAKQLLKPLARHLGGLSRGVEFLISLGLHRRLGKKELIDFLGGDFLKENRVFQHSVEEVRSLGRVAGIPASVNKRLSSYDILFTVGVVEPHLYAGFSGGVKSIAIGLGGREAILHTHAVDYLSQGTVKVANVRTNPFQKFLWEVFARLNIPTYSLNMVNNLNKEIAFCSVGEARRSFMESVKCARKVFASRVREKFDLLLVGCDYPKDGNLYQASRLFNYVLDLRPMVRKGGAICVFAGLGERRKSGAERNFEALLKRRAIPASYAFRKQGEHRAFKVIEASRRADLGIITPNIPRGSFSCLRFFSAPGEVLEWAARRYGRNLNIGIIPAGFSFIPFV